MRTYITLRRGNEKNDTTNTYMSSVIDFAYRIRSVRAKPARKHLSLCRPHVSRLALKNPRGYDAAVSKQTYFKLFYFISDTPEKSMNDVNLCNGVVSYASRPEDQCEYDSMVVRDLFDQIDRDIKGKYIMVLNTGDLHEHSNNKTWIKVVELFRQLGAASVTYEFVTCEEYT